MDSYLKFSVNSNFKISTSVMLRLAKYVGFEINSQLFLLLHFLFTDEKNNY